ncbi:RTA1 like protein [Saccharata proteae CBS 121410]|uniref:RTA1 like protein n=1 Tax=Saccharata proteae CBS 121410 TaxID=1314787 RepID=A0A6A5YAD8_9PEZI|nr:RTA1 like protein [Saccharata proteae CBS 121410]
MTLSVRDDALTDFKLYRYDPSMAAAVIFIALFGLTTALHCFQMIRSRTWFFIPFIIGGIFEIIGYIGRAMSAQQASGEWTTGPYIMQTTLLLVAPALFAASIYMELGRIVLLIDGNSHLLLRRTWMTKFFVAGDVLSFFMQAAGGGIMASSKKSSAIDTGSNVIVGGLFVQLIFFGFFMVAAVLFHSRMRKVPTALSKVHAWQKHLFALYGASLLILTRSIVRTVEYLQGYDGYIISREWYLYVFDATLIFLMMVVMNVIHPGEIARSLKGAITPAYEMARSQV